MRCWCTHNTVVSALSYRAYRDMAMIAAAVNRDDDASAIEQSAHPWPGP
jgi:hypothetical protein